MSVRDNSTAIKSRTIKTIERYQGKMALLETWQAHGGDKDYIRQLQTEANKLRDQLRVKGVIFEDVDE